MTFLALPDGMHPGIPDSVYHARELGVASKSALDILAKSPAHYRAWAMHEDEARDEEALRFGSAFHAAVLEPDVFAQRYALRPEFGDGRTKDAKALRAAWTAENEGKLPLTEADFARIQAMAEALRAHPLARNLFAKGFPELALKWTDSETGVVCKGKADYYRKGLVIDLKTTQDASPKGFEKSIAQWGYHRQAAFYSEGFQALGERVEGFLFVAVEKLPPFQVGVYMLSDGVLERGSASIRRDLQTLAECIKSGRWPGYSNSIHTIQSLPGWAA